MVLFMYQLDWVILYPDMLSNIVLDISLRVVLEEINI